MPRLMRTLKWRIFLLFGLLVLTGMSTLSYVTLRFARARFEKQMRQTLKGVASSVSKLLDARRLAMVTSYDDPYLIEVRRLFRVFSDQFGLSWIAAYRFNGRFLVHLTDGAEPGYGFHYGYPIFDVPDGVPEAWRSGELLFAPSYQDAFGIWMAVFQPVKDASGTVVAILDVSQNMDEMADLQREIIGQTVRLSGMIAVLTLLICFVAARFTTKPLERVSKAVRQIGGGDLHVRLPRLSGCLEIAAFIDAFNQMISSLERSRDDLQRRIAELKTLNEISTKISFASSTLDVLKVILEKSVQSLQAARGSIMLFDEQKQALVVQVAWAANALEQPASSVEIRRGEGIAGKAFQDQQTMLFNQIPDGLLKPSDQGIPLDIRNILCVPLVAEQKAIGVLNIVNRQVGDFGEDDVVLASTMASQVAMTIEKARLYELAITDGLTKLHVHRYFQLALDNELRRCRRYSSEFALILFDIDHFKKFNDTWGHQTGDVVLAHTARLLKEALRSVDLAARYGGEEFAVILPESSVVSGLAVAERIRQVVEAYDFPGQDQILKVTVSLGIAGYPAHAEEKMDLIRKADVALYQSKKRGRNTATVFDPAFGDSPPSK